MCDCEEEQNRRRAELEKIERERGEAESDRRCLERNLSCGSQPGQGGCVGEGNQCGFFACGLGSSSGGWFPIAGSAFLIATLAFLYKHMDKVRQLLGKSGQKSAVNKPKRGFENCAQDYYGTVGRGRK